MVGEDPETVTQDMGGYIDLNNVLLECGILGGHLVSTWFPVSTDQADNTLATCPLLAGGLNGSHISSINIVRQERVRCPQVALLWEPCIQVALQYTYLLG